MEIQIVTQNELEKLMCFPLFNAVIDRPAGGPTVICHYCGQRMQKKKATCSQCGGDLSNSKRLVGVMAGVEYFS